MSEEDCGSCRPITFTNPIKPILCDACSNDCSGKAITMSLDGKVLVTLCMGCHARGSVWAARQALEPNSSDVVQNTSALNGMSEKFGEWSEWRKGPHDGWYRVNKTTGHIHYGYKSITGYILAHGVEWPAEEAAKLEAKAEMDRLKLERAKELADKTKSGTALAMPAASSGIIKISELIDVYEKKCAEAVLELSDERLAELGLQRLDKPHVVE